MLIKNTVPPAILAAAVAILQPYAPDLTPKALVAALKDHQAGKTPQNRENVPEKPFTRAEVCSLLGITAPTLASYVKRGKLRKIILSDHAVRIDPASVRELMGNVEAV